MGEIMEEGDVYMISKCSYDSIYNTRAVVGLNNYCLFNSELFLSLTIILNDRPCSSAVYKYIC